VKREITDEPVADTRARKRSSESVNVRPANDLPATRAVLPVQPKEIEHVKPHCSMQEKAEKSGKSAQTPPSFGWDRTNPPFDTPRKRLP